MKSQSFLGNKEAAKQHLHCHFMIVFLFSKPQLFPLGYFPTRVHLLQITFCNSRGEIAVLCYKDLILTKPRDMSGAELFLLSS